MINETGITDICTPRTKGESYISHNKFMVKIENEKPICVWTGGTNFSEGGIFGHSNVAHVIEDDEVARDYLAYWEELVKDPTTAAIKKETEKITTVPGNPPPTSSSPFQSKKKS
jgi:phosphatidylserine/phosphatidylglycerophosphate/cardiolipin synthase-like enzyme